VPLLPLACLAAACGAPERTAERLRPTRGVVLVSIDALRADALGAYGSVRPTSPFLDRLARRATLFENAFTQIPSTLPAHLSLFTGLYPSEHDVFPPSDVLAEQIPTLPELFRAAGSRTFGHSEGGYVQGGYGFARGFEEWTDSAYGSDADIDRTFGRGLASLEKLAPAERFFLFLHTYAVHDPYAPPEELRRAFWPGPPPAGAFAPTGPNFAAFNARLLDAPPGAERYYRALYDASVRQMDGAVERLFAGLERLGLADDTTVVFTSDHGEEFLEHGRFVHTQAYPESLRIPLLVRHPDAPPGRRVRALVELVDVLPTLAEIAGFALPGPVSGESFAPLLVAGGERLAGRAFAQDEILAFRVRTVLLPVAGRLHQLYFSRAVQERDGFWAAREVRFDAKVPVLDFRAVAYHRPRRVSVFASGRRVATLEVGLDWRRFRVELPPATKQRVVLATDGCESPLELGLGGDRRCLSFKLDGLDLAELRLFDLAADPAAAVDLSTERPDLVRTLARELNLYPEVARHPAGGAELTEEQIRELKALGYLQ
jgi:hypothetical protein